MAFKIENPDRKTKKYLVQGIPLLSGIALLGFTGIQTMSLFGALTIGTLLGVLNLYVAYLAFNKKLV